MNPLGRPSGIEMDYANRNTAGLDRGARQDEMKGVLSDSTSQWSYLAVNVCCLRDEKKVVWGWQGCHYHHAVRSTTNWVQGG